MVITMEKDKTLKQLYREQRELCSTLDDKAINEAYVSEGITELSIDEMINEIKKKLEELEMDALFLSSIRESQRLENQLVRLERLSANNKNIGREFNLSCRGLKPKNRIYPSTELRNKIVCGTLDVAEYWAKVYYYRCSKCIALDELQQVAYEALISAAYYYVPSPVAKFRTYARACIENKLKRTIGETKKKNRIRPTDPLAFIDEELRNAKYLEFFLQAMKRTSSSGRLYYSLKYPVSKNTILSRLKRSIKAFNLEKSVLGETNEQLPSFKIKNRKELFSKVKSKALGYLNRSKMSSILTDEDFEMASLLSHYQNRPYELSELYEFIYLLDLYTSRLEAIRTFLECEMYLLKENDGIVPTDEEILSEINGRLRKYNSEIKLLKKSGFFQSCPNYHRLPNYIDEYLDMFDVDLFNFGNGVSRNTEEREIKEFCAEIRDGLLFSLKYLLERLIDENLTLNEIKEELEEYLYVSDDYGEEIFDLCLEKMGNIELEADTQKYLQHAIDALEGLEVNEMVRIILNRRKEAVLKIMASEKDSVIRQNRELKPKIEYFKTGGKYFKLWSIDDVKNAKNWSTLFFESTEFSYQDEEKRRRQATIPLEDEVICTVFLEDYYSELEMLSPLQREILLHYYDAEGKHNMNAKEIAKLLDITSKKVYSEKAKALKILRKSSTLREYLDN